MASFQSGTGPSTAVAFTTAELLDVVAIGESISSQLSISIQPVSKLRIPDSAQVSSLAWFP
jgi:hypothetical protein